MVTLDFVPSARDIEAAERFSTFRERCKAYLKSVGEDHDKFTMVSHDSSIGFLSERAMQYYLAETLSDCVQRVETWESQFDAQRLVNILDSDARDAESIAYMRKYFYDAWDLQVTSSKGTRLVDVKTAATKLNPNGGWTFMYPVSQAHREGKDLALLVYYIHGDGGIGNVKRMVLVGGTTPDVVKTCSVLPAGSETRQRTVSQIDNYETRIGAHYRSARSFFC